jgi:hypothetical protein
MSIAETRFSRKHGAGGPGTVGLPGTRLCWGWRTHRHRDLPSAIRYNDGLHGHRISGFEKSFSTHRISEFENATTLGSISVSYTVLENKI